jgi:beta-glucanase (GH16 family)
VHTAAYSALKGNARTQTVAVPTATTQFHVYAVEWTPQAIDWFVDGKRFFTVKNDGTGDDSWPFDKRFHVILNLAVGGDWGGVQGVDPNGWPRQMRVDYVRVYQK